jgi:sorbitol/mannitol transport system permease protein
MAVADATSGVPTGPARKSGAGRGAAWARRAPLLPALIFTIIITQLPFLATLVISTLDWNALRPDDRSFAGLSNYGEVFGDAALREAVVNTILMTVGVVGISVVLGLGIALLLNRAFRGRAIVRTMMIAPFLIVPIAAALLWKHALLNPDYGLFNGILNFVFGDVLGMDNPPQPSWIADQPKLAVIASLVWQWTPFMMLILLAGLQSMPKETTEASRVDGASGWQTFKWLTFPHLRRYLELGILLGSIYIVQNFDAVFTLTSGGLGTANLPYAVYNTFFNGQEYGQASAAGVVVVIGSILIGTFALRVVSSLFKEQVR